MAAAAVDATAAHVVQDAESKEISSAEATKKRKRNSKPAQRMIQFTIRNPPHCYIHLRQISPAPSKSVVLDDITAHLQLTAALTQFLGVHGSAIPIDVLKTEAADLWIRIPNEDKAAVIAAVGSWVGSKGEAWRVMGSSSWDARAMGQDGGQDLFNG